MQTREEALALLQQYNKGEDRLIHGKTVAAALRHFARESGADPAYWEIVGLLHDVDYELDPENHCKNNPRILAEAGYDDTFIHAVQSHGFGGNTDVEPVLHMEKILFILNELAILVYESAIHCAGGLAGLTVEEVVQRRDEAGFAPVAKREKMTEDTTSRWGFTFEDLAAETIQSYRDAAEELGL